MFKLLFLLAVSLTPQQEKQVQTLEKAKEHYSIKVCRLRDEGELLLDQDRESVEGKRLLFRAEKYQELVDKINNEISLLMKNKH